MSRQVFIYKIANNTFTEELPRIIYNMLNTQSISQRTGIFQIFRLSIRLIKTKGNPRYFIAGLLQFHSSHRTIRAAAHTQ